MSNVRYGSRKSFQIHIVCRIATEIRLGRMIGSTIWKKILGTDAPSIIADSSSSDGMPLTTPVKMNTAKPAPKPRYHNPQAPWGVQAHHVGELGKREHDHLERNNHVKQEQCVQQARSPVVRTYNPPSAHRRAHDDQQDRADRDDYGPAKTAD